MDLTNISSGFDRRLQRSRHGLSLAHDETTTSLLRDESVLRAYRGAQVAQLLSRARTIIVIVHCVSINSKDELIISQLRTLVPFSDEIATDDDT